MLHKGLFVLGHELGDPHFYSYYKYLQKNQWKKHKDLIIEQEKRLRAAINFSFENVPYYNNLFHELKLKPSDIRITADLEKLPILNKGIIKQHWEEFKPVGLNKMKYDERTTSGSTGTPFPYRLSRRDRFFGAAHLYRGWGYGGYEPGDRMVFLAGAALAVRTGSVVSKKVYEVVRNTRMLSSWGMGEREMHEYSTAINSFMPRFIRGYASSIFFYAQWIEKNNIDIHAPECIFTATEKLYPLMREKISHVFNCDVLDGYGAYDGGITANECTEHNGFHIDTERSLVEVVDEKGSQVSNGEGKILATSLCNSAMSFIRYDTSDLGNILSEDDSCACGRGYRLLKEIIGRSSDILITPDGKYVQGWFLAATVQENWKDQVKEFQVVQETPEKIIYYVVPEKNFDERILEKIRQTMNDRGFQWEIELRIVEEIEKTRSGKYQFIINKIPKGRP